MKRLVLTTTLLAASACTPTNTLPDAEAAARSREFSSGVQQTRLMEDVTELAEGHVADTPFDCHLFNYQLISLKEVGMPVCNLSRDRAQELLRERFEKLGLEVTVDQGEDESFPTTNVIGELRGTEHPEEVVVVAAHYDAFHAGADDNSSGVAAMLELARLTSGKRFGRTVRFIGFDHEEFGNVGSARYVRTHSNERLVTALVFDTIGYRDARPGSQQGLPGVVTPTTGDFIAVVGNDDSRAHVEDVMELARHLEQVPPALGAVSPGTGLGPLAFHLTRSDHASFWMMGLDAVFFTDTATFRSPHYHKDTDTVSTLDPEFFAGVTRLAAGALSYWAEGPRP
jgi:Zn-dependent M28 family amino/carboxypeptidase